MYKRTAQIFEEWKVIYLDKVLQLHVFKIGSFFVSKKINKPRIFKTETLSPVIFSC